MVSQLNARHKPEYTLLTFYKFVDIPEEALDRVAQEHLDMTRDLGLKGRVYIGTEGISSTVTGNAGQCWAYRAYLESSPYFKDIPDLDIKATDVPDHEFTRMSVKIRNEIVTMGAKVTEDEVRKYRKELTPEQFKSIIDEDKSDEYLILDMRNDYEYRLGHFKWAVPAGTVNFREVPKLMEKYKEMAQGRKIVWYCTGGIRCEKAAVLAGKAGMEDVYAIEWGVVKYVNSYNDGNWLGNLYTFDGRVSTVVGDTETHVSIGGCLYTGEKTDNCVNCRYAPCNARLIATEKAYREHLGFCSEECYLGARNDSLVKVVDWDKFDYKGLGKGIRETGSGLAQAHLDKKLAKLVWKHKTSQKEEMICEC